MYAAVRMPYRQAEYYVREPKDMNSQQDIQEAPTSYRMNLSAENTHKPHRETTRQHKDIDIATSPTECNTAICKLFNNSHNDKIESKISSQSRSPEKCLIDSESIKSIHNFVFFIGYPRSGHSIVASFLDAHPHMIVAHEFSVFSKWPQLLKKEHSATVNMREVLFNELVNSSHWESLEGERSGKYVNKGYSLDTNSPWHGKCDRYLEVIGDKRAGGTCEEYLRNPIEFEHNYRELMKVVALPIRVLHVVRNPFDLIATSVLYEAARLRNGGRASGDDAKFVNKMKNRSKRSKYEYKYRNDKLLMERVSVIMRLAQAVTNLTTLFGRENVLELHNCDMVSDTIEFVNQVCRFNEVECPSDYVKNCVDKAFKEVSQTRKCVYWPANIIEIVEQQKQNFSFFDRYSFKSEC